MSGIGRRSFLTRAWQAGAALLTGAGLWTSWDVLRPTGFRGFGGKVRAGTREQIPGDGVLEVAEARAYLTEIDGEVRALSWTCPHLGCRVAFCESSGDFECPCHGTVFNRAGEWRSGPSPRGMDRFVVEEDDAVVIDTGQEIEGPERGTEDFDLPSRGPACTGGSE